MKTWSIRTIDELAGVAREVLAHGDQSHPARVLALSGELGAGKTTFVQELAKLLGVTEHITSPTFVLMRSYQTAHPAWTTLMHIDAYRLEESIEADVLRIPETLTKAGVIACVEWPERITEALPTTTERLSFTYEQNGTRTITYA